ncbi:dynamin family protein [Celeribacter sp.]|uniref:dynamin family protein n=1 Tax=Celeribacter sp. TaxID=1890673 RepID=UPI003A8F090F
MKIAPNQRQELDFLRDTLDTLEQSTDRGLRQNFRDLRTRLDQWAAKVAVIGQVKAGKSTFLNAFLRQHDFLPSDINPWTSVVTNIRINLPSDPASGARFEFFDDADWQEFITGGTKIRELTEALLPGFDADLLRQQSEEMRERAQKRLGKHYYALLGSHHEYDFLSADLLKRYVCAGPGSDVGLERESLGRYAALTKVANVYMRLPEFQVPLILTDTPGVNDPFLVRDEFTCRSLDKSDVFVVVLSAHQPLTDVDVALIRILAKQDSKDCLIYINRIDELDDYARDVPRVIKDVSERLHAAIPGIDFRIVAGSAYMADLVLRDDEEAVAAREALDTPELAAFLQSRYGEVPLDALDRLYLASGLDEVKSALSETIDQGVGREQIAQILGDVRAEINGAQFVLRRERDALQ